MISSALRRRFYILSLRLLSEKERQEALAKARIAARKKKLLRASSKTGLIDNGYDIDINTEEAGIMKLIVLFYIKYFIHYVT